MEQLLSLVLCIALLVTAVPFAAVEADAASGRIYEDTEYNVSCSSAGTWDVRTFIPEEDGIYIFSSMGSLDTLGYIALAEGEAENRYIKADGGQDNNFAVTYEMTAGTTYYLGSTVLMGPTGSFKIKIVKFEADDGTINPITLSQSTAVSTKKGNNVKFFSITPATSGEYIYLSSGNYDTQGYIFDEYWQQIAYSDVGGAAQNFKITLDLQAGKTYYVGYAVTSETTARFNVLLYMSTFISTVSLVAGPEKDTYIKNIDAQHVAGVTYHVDMSLTGFSFRINYANSTSKIKTYAFGIRGLDCESSRDLLAGENDVRFSYMGNSASFKIYVKDSPVLRLELRQAPDKAVYYEEDMETSIDQVSKVFNISLSGMIIRTYYTDGTSSDFSISSLYGQEIPYLYFDHMVPAEDMHLGENTFTLTYYGKPLSFTVIYSLNSGNWQYEINGDEATVTKYIGTDTGALIPERLGGYPVTAIGASCFKNNTTLKSVRMTERITTVGDNAFYGCSGLRELTLPASLTTLGVQSFFGLTGLEKLNWNCPNLSIIKANNTFAYMGNDLAEGTVVEFGYSCQSIPQDAFYPSSNTYAPNIHKIIVGENVTAIGANAFRDIANLSQVEWNAITASTTGAANSIWLYSGTVSNIEVTIGENVSAIPNYLFFAANDTRAPRVSKITVLGKDTQISDNSVKANAEVPLTFYCHYNGDESVNSVYRHCVEKELNYVLLDPPLDHIYIKNALNKEEYIVGQELDLSGLSVYAVFEDYSEQDITDEVEITGYNKDEIGAQTLTISYTFIDRTKTVSCGVVVTAEPLVLDYLQITHPANKTSYYTGDVFDASGLAVKAVFTNAFEQDVSEYMILSGYDMSVAGEQEVIISYTYEGVTRSVSYMIAVTALELRSITLSALPDKTDYLVGEQLNLDGMKVIATYNSGGSADVTGYCDVIGFDSGSSGEQLLTVLYAESGVSKNDSFLVTVHNALTAITIDTLPSNLVFTIGSGFSARGIEVTAHYENGMTADVSSLVSFSGYDMDTLGEQTVSVTYTEDGVSQSATYTITVNSAALIRLILTNPPTGVQYIHEPLNKTGLVISAVYNDGTRENVAAKCVYTGFDNTAAGTQTVTATYTFGEVSKSVEFTVDVLSRTATGLEIVTPAAKTDYLIGEAFDTTGLAVRLCFNNGTYNTLSNEELTFSGFDNTVSGAQSVGITYVYAGQSFTTQYAVTINNYETGITVNPPTKTNYYYGENLSLSGMYITVSMADGSTQKLYSGFQYTGYDKTVIGEQIVTVSYHGSVANRTFTDSFKVHVANYETALAVGAPEKTVYYYGEALDTTGMSAIITYANGNKQLADITKLTVSGYDAEVLGEQVLSVSYTTVKGEIISDSFSVSVLNYESGISVSAPDKTVYLYGEALDTTGMAAYAVMEDSSTIPISIDNLRFTGYDAHIIGIQTVTAEYTSGKGEIFRDSFTVEVKNHETALSVTPPAKTSYFCGEEFNTSGMSAVLTFADGSEQSIGINHLAITGYNADTPGIQTIQVSFTASTGAVIGDSFTVTVRNFENAIVVSAPEQTDYFFGDALTTAGMQVLAQMQDGSVQPLALADVRITGYDPYVLGTQTVTVAYTSVKGEVLEDYFDVSVQNFETALSVTPPTKTAYYYGEALNTAGMSATLTWADGSGTTAAPSDIVLSGYQPERVGAQTVTASYTTAKGETISDSFSVEVLNFEQSMLVTPPARVNYYYGESFSAAGLAAEITMADGSKKTVGTEALTLSEFDGTVLGEQTIYVSYTTVKGEVLTGSFTVNVSNYATGLSVIPPTKTEYFYGESFNTAGMSAVLIEASGESTTIDGSRLVLSGYNARKLGTQTITAAYTTSTGEVLRDTFSVLVKNYEKSIRAIAPEKTTYFYGESLDKTGLGATAVMADNTESAIDAGSLIVFGYNANKLGTQTVSIMFRNAKNMTLTASFTVTVVNFANKLTITSSPDKTTYDFGEALDTAGLAASLTMADGSQAAADSEQLSIAQYNPNRVGTQTVTVHYTNEKGAVLSDTFTVLINNYPQSLELSGTYPTTFTEGDSFTREGMKVLAHYADGTRRDVTALVSITGYDMQTPGTQSVSVTYAEGEKSVSTAYEIAVIRESESMRADVNRDNFIDLADISIVLATGNYGLPSAQAANVRADVNRNGTVDIGDITVLLKADYYGHAVNE